MTSSGKIEERDFTVAVEFWVPAWRAFQVTAASAEAAMEKAVELSQAGPFDDWRQDYEAATGNAVACVAKGVHHNPFDAGQAAFVDVPARLRSPDLREIGAAPQLIGAARALLAAFGGNPPDWLVSEAEALDAALSECGPG